MSSSATDTAQLRPPVEPARSPFGQTLAASGVVEAKTENISIGSHLPGIVNQVVVSVGQRVKAGDPLFRLDDRHLQAELQLARQISRRPKLSWPARGDAASGRVAGG